MMQFVPAQQPIPEYNNTKKLLLIHDPPLTDTSLSLGKRQTIGDEAMKPTYQAFRQLASGGVCLQWNDVG